MFMELFINNCNRIELGRICSVIVWMIEKNQATWVWMQTEYGDTKSCYHQIKIMKKKLSYEISHGQTCYLIKTYINFLNQKLNWVVHIGAHAMTSLTPSLFGAWSMKRLRISLLPLNAVPSFLPPSVSSDYLNNSPVLI